MAEEEKELEGEELEGEEEAGGGGGGNKLLLIISLVNILGLLGVGAYVILGGGGNMSAEEMADRAANDSASARPSGVQEEPGPMYELDTLIVNLREPGADRYLKCKLQLELDAASTQQEVEQRSAQIRFQLNSLLSGHRVADVQGPENMEALRKKMRRRANTVMTKGKIVAVWPGEWIVQ